MEHIHITEIICSHTRLEFPLFLLFPCEIVLSHTPIPALGKDKKKKRPEARCPHVDSRRHCINNVKMLPKMFNNVHL